MYFDIALTFGLSIALILQFFKSFNNEYILILLNILALIPVIKNAFISLKKKEISVDLLAAVALAVSFIAQEWYSAAFINLMLTFARIFSSITHRRTQNAIKSLLKYKVNEVSVQTNNGVITKKAKDVEVGDEIIILTGQRLAVDGVVINGQASINESNLTGESIPRTVKTGDKVYASTLNVSGRMIVKATKKEAESALANLIMTVEKASLEKTKTITLVSKFSSTYVIFTFLGSIIAFLVTRNINFVLSLLLVVCADDIAVSIPLAFTLAIAKAARLGVIIKNSDVLEKSGNIKIILTDKTGTLTLGNIVISQLINYGKYNKKELKAILSQISKNSTHPVNRAILRYCGKTESKAEKIKVHEYPGEGLAVELDDKKLYLGNVDFLKNRGTIITNEEKSDINNFAKNGLSVTGISEATKLIGLVIYEDEVKINSKEAISETRRYGVEKWIMLTGDNMEISQKITTKIGIDEFKFGLTPEQKLAEIKLIKSENKDKIIGMLGDGVNDAPALSLADVSFAMGTLGSDTAIEASDVAIMDDNLNKVPKVILLGKKVKKIIYQNFAIWGLTNAVGLILVLGGFLNPTGAAAYNFLTDFISTINVFKILRVKI